MIIWYNDRAQLIEPAHLRTVSLGADVVACHLHEGVMHSFAAGWRDGAEAWSVEHLNHRDQIDVVVTGTPPSIFADIRDELTARQKTVPSGPFQVDYIWNIPIELCWHLAGYRHDRVDDPLAPPYEVLTRTQSERSA